MRVLALLIMSLLAGCIAEAPPEDPDEQVYCTLVAYSHVGPRGGVVAADDGWPVDGTVHVVGPNVNTTMDLFHGGYWLADIPPDWHEGPCEEPRWHPSHTYRFELRAPGFLDQAWNFTMEGNETKVPTIVAQRWGPAWQDAFHTESMLRAPCETWCLDEVFQDQIEAELYADTIWVRFDGPGEATGHVTVRYGEQSQRIPIDQAFPVRTSAPLEQAQVTGIEWELAITAAASEADLEASFDLSNCGSPWPAPEMPRQLC